MEVDAMNTLSSKLPGAFAPSAEHIRQLFDEYEEGITPEAILVKDVDKYELLVQSLEYERDAVERGEPLEGLKDLTSFFGVRHALKTDVVKAWAEEVMKERENMWKKAHTVTNYSDCDVANDVD